MFEQLTTLVTAQRSRLSDCKASQAQWPHTDANESSHWKAEDQ